MKKVLVINNTFHCPFQPHFGECQLGKYFGIRFECDSHCKSTLASFPKKVVFDDPNICPYHGGGMCRKNSSIFDCHNTFSDYCPLENYYMPTVKVLHSESSIDRETCQYRYKRIFTYNNGINGACENECFCLLTQNRCKENLKCPLEEKSKEV